jgi:hypothetical protein
MNEIASLLIIGAFFVIGAGAATVGMAKRLEQSRYLAKRK